MILRDIALARKNGVMSRLEAAPYNPILDTDSYKVTHWLQLPENTQSMLTYLECRGGKYSHMVAAGFSYWIHKFLSTRITQAMIEEADLLFGEHFGYKDYFNRAGWQHIVDKYDGWIPITVRALQEGEVVPVKNAYMTLYCDDPAVCWIAGYIETMAVRTWAPITTATKSMFCKMTILRAAIKSSVHQTTGMFQTYYDTGVASPNLYKLHDFGGRGGSSYETVSLCGAGNLFHFLGTDTVSALVLLRDFYGSTKAAGHSLAASEHATMCIFGPTGEFAQFNRMIQKFGDRHMFACVSDGFNIWNAIQNGWGGVLKKRVEEMNAILVVRPDSGDPIEVPVQCIKLLDEAFGHTTHIGTDGVVYKTLNHVRVIQGDGIGEEELEQLCDRVLAEGYSIDNIAFGMGGGLIQKQNRDTMKVACKNVFMYIDGQNVNIQKNPITDPGKKSKMGRLVTIIGENGVETRDMLTDLEWEDPSILGEVLLKPAYHNGEIYADYHRNLDEIRIHLEKHVDRMLMAA